MGLQFSIENDIDLSKEVSPLNLKQMWTMVQEASILSGTPSRQFAIIRYLRKRKERVLQYSSGNLKQQIKNKYPKLKNYAMVRPRKGGRFISKKKFVNPWYNDISSKTKLNKK